MRFGVDREYALPSVGAEDQRCGEVLGELGTQAADLLERGRAHGVVRADATGRKTGVRPGLGRPVQHRLRVQSPPGGPGGVCVAIADAGGRHIAHSWVDKRRRHPPEVIGRRDMIGIELGDDVVVAISPVVVEEREVALFAFRSPRPCRVVVLGDPFAARHVNAVQGTPIDDLVGEFFIGEPDVVRVRELLREHRFERRAHELPGLRWRFGDDDRRSQPRNLDRGLGPTHPQQEEEEPQRHRDEVESEHDAVRHQAGDRDPMHGREPPLPEEDRGCQPKRGDDREHETIVRPERVDESAGAQLGLATMARPRPADPLELSGTVTRRRRCPLASAVHRSVRARAARTVTCGRSHDCPVYWRGAPKGEGSRRPLSKGERSLARALAAGLRPRPN